jgi:MarR family transcriptional regulator, lower aerobic nicotinate degradation pathway regulator
MKMSDVKGIPGHLLRRANQISMAIFAEEMAEMDLTSVQLVTLMAIAENTDLDATRLSEIIDFDRATIGGVIERLERKGLLVRRISQTDKRVKKLQITPAGRAMIKVSEPRVDTIQKRILEPLDGEEQATLLALLAKLVAANPPGGD